MLHLLVLQHGHDSPPGLIAEEIAACGGRLDLRGPAPAIALPADADAHDGLIILGGVVNALDDGRCPHFPALLALIRAFAERNKPVLGICLGAQLVARAFGGTIRLGGAPEFGFVPLHASPAAAADPLLRDIAFPVPVMQWHDDTFDLPPGAVHLLESAGCRNQGFRFGRSVYGLQCHCEVIPAVLEPWLALAEKTGLDPTVVSAVRRAVPRLLPQSMQFGRTLARRWLRLAERRQSRGSGGSC
jgi:GMP synthase - Glutamine amidotransferase domain